MLDYLNGKIAYKNNNSDTTVTVDVNGVGYFIHINPTTYDKLPEIGSDVKVFTVLNHKEDSMTLFGFLKKEDRDIFRILTSVSGVGPKMAMTLLNEFEACEIISLVIKADSKALTKAKGVGEKLAQKIILELKDKLMNIKNIPSSDETKNIGEISGQAVEEAQAVLLSFGYEKDEIKSALAKAITFVENKNKTEELLKECLRILSV